MAAPECGTAQTECDPLVRTPKPHLVGVRHPGVESEGRDWLAEGGAWLPPVRLVFAVPRTINGVACTPWGRGYPCWPLRVFGGL